jgi:subtilisin family serine protease
MRRPITAAAFLLLLVFLPCRAIGSPHRQLVVVRLAPNSTDPSTSASERGCENRGPLPGAPGYQLFECEAPRSSSRKRWSSGLGVAEAIPQGPLVRENRGRAPSAPTDPLYPSQWHLHGLQTNLRVEDAWGRGLTGDGVTIAVLDDGVDSGHEDIRPNYRASSSFDYNRHSADQRPGTAQTHGTSAAGTAAAQRDNGVCGVGVAPGASISGVRIIGDAASDAQEAMALAHMVTETNDVISCSWGPIDDGKRLEGPGRFAALAMESAVVGGRGGLGTVYVWAAGNGAHRGDSCAYDGYASSRLTIAVGAIGRSGRRSWYSEECPALLVTAPSSDDYVGISTVIPGGRCTSDFGGTSASAPMVAGVVALMMEAAGRGRLTWMDVQRVLAATARRVDPNDSSWGRNGAGVWHSDAYGFGMVDAAAACALTRSWRTPESASWCGEVEGDSVNVPASATAPRLVEWVEVTVTLRVDKRGETTIELISPSGTVSLLASPHADAGGDFDEWTFSTCKCWNETAPGTWTVGCRLRNRPVPLLWSRLCIHGTA